MKKVILILCLVSFAFNFKAQTAATKEHVKTLLELTGSGKLGMQVMNNMMGTLKKSMPDVPTKFWDEFMKGVNPETLVELVIPIYQKHYSDEEILQLMDFYKTPLGKKVLEKTPLISQESYAVGSEWGKTLGEQVVKKLKAEGYMEDK